MQRLADLEAELASFERQTLRAVTAEQKQPDPAAGERLPAAVDRGNDLGPRPQAHAARAGEGYHRHQGSGAEAAVELQVRWQGGATETVELHLPPNRAEAVRYPSEFVDRIGDLAKDHDDDEIAASLDREGLQSSTGKSFTASMISWVRYKHRIPGPSRPSGTLSVAEVATALRCNSLGRLRLDRERPRLRTQEKARTALRRHHHRGDGPRIARADCQLHSPCTIFIFPKPS